MMMCLPSQVPLERPFHRSEGRRLTVFCRRKSPTNSPCWWGPCCGALCPLRLSRCLYPWLPRPPSPCPRRRQPQIHAAREGRSFSVQTPEAVAGGSGGIRFRGEGQMEEVGVLGSLLIVDASAPQHSTSSAQQSLLLCALR